MSSGKSRSFSLLGPNVLKESMGSYICTRLYKYCFNKSLTNIACNRRHVRFFAEKVCFFRYATELWKWRETNRRLAC